MAFATDSLPVSSPIVMSKLSLKNRRMKRALAAASAVSETEIESVPQKPNDEMDTIPVSRNMEIGKDSALQTASVSEVRRTAQVVSMRNFRKSLNFFSLFTICMELSLIHI